MSAINIGCGGQKLPSDVLEKIHQHNNKNVLDNLNDDNGTLTYKGIVLGQNGKSAYEIWLEEGNTGTIDDFLQSLIGPEGKPGLPGEKGEIGPPGPAGEIPNIDHLATKEYVTAAINGITVDSHVHSNKVDVLDKLSVVDGKLNFDNQPIQGESIPVDLSNYYTKIETYNKTEVDEKIANVEASDPNSHTHINKPVIDGIGDSNGNLTYKGKLVVNDTEYSYRTLPTFKNPNTRGTVQFVRSREEDKE